MNTPTCSGYWGSRARDEYHKAAGECLHVVLWFFFLKQRDMSLLKPELTAGYGFCLQ